MRLIPSLIKPILIRPTIIKPIQATRPFNTSTPKMTSSQTSPIFASNFSPEEGSPALSLLLKSSDQGGKWTLTPNGKGLERSFKFKGFKKCWEFMSKIAPECQTQKHHPEWSNVYNTTYIRWTTHSPPGISSKDVLMARYCDEAAERLGEVVEEQAVEEKAESEGSMGWELVDRVGVEGGDCCVPKKK